MKNKGFTLIELLAVIVILAIIALIATPIILGIINDARQSARERTAELVAKEVQLAYTGYMFAHEGNEPETFCGYMANFKMDKATMGDCEETGVDITADESSTTYTVTPNGDGTVTVSSAKLPGKNKTVTLTK